MNEGHIFMYINNHLGFIFLGDMGGGRGDLGTRKWVIVHTFDHICVYKRVLPHRSMRNHHGDRTSFGFPAGCGSCTHDEGIGHHLPCWHRLQQLHSLSCHERCQLGSTSTVERFTVALPMHLEVMHLSKPQ